MQQTAKHQHLPFGAGRSSFGFDRVASFFGTTVLRACMMQTAAFDIAGFAGIDVSRSPCRQIPPADRRRARQLEHIAAAEAEAAAACRVRSPMRAALSTAQLSSAAVIHARSAPRAQPWSSGCLLRPLRSAPPYVGEETDVFTAGHCFGALDRLFCHASQFGGTSTARRPLTLGS